MSKWQDLRDKLEDWHRKNPPDRIIDVVPEELPARYFVNPMTKRLITPKGQTNTFCNIVNRK